MSRIRFDQVVIDCADPQALAAFWSSATGYQVAHVSDTWVSVVGEGDRDICIAFQRAGSETLKESCSRRLGSAREEAEASRIEGLGAVRCWTSDKPDDRF